MTRFARLPPLLQELARLQGHARGALKLVAAFGGERVYVPVKARPGQKLTRALDLATARALAGLRGGELVDVPTLKRPTLKDRIVTMQGSHDDVARALHCSRRWVRRVRQDMAAGRR